jgi:hypothetical protein
VIQDRRPLASRAVSNLELHRAGFRRPSITSAERAEIQRVAANMRDYIDRDGSLSTPEEKA